jgi:predicted flap endonuclease-1-like 5' DNA nuclease
MANLLRVEGIGEVYAQKLSDAGIKTTNALLKQGATPKGRKEIAENSGISETLILEWVNHVDLFRIKGVFEEYADLLEEAGVDTVKELAQRNPANLYKKLVEVNEQKKLVRQLPGKSQVENWVAQAKQLDRAVFY